MKFEKFIEIACKDPEFKSEWDKLHQINSISEALDVLSKLNEEAEQNEQDSSLAGILANRGIKANSVHPNNIIFYELINNKCPVADFIQDIENKKLQAKIASDIEWLSVEGLQATMPKASYVAEGLYELRTQQSNNITRIFYFFPAGNNIVLTNGYVKKQQKMDRAEFEKAKRYREDWSRRFASALNKNGHDKENAKN